MISLLLLLVLAWGFYIGYRRGLLLQVYYLISAMASAFMAGQFYKGLGEQFHLLLLICLANGLDHLGDHPHGSYSKSS